MSLELESMSGASKVRQSIFSEYISTDSPEMWIQINPKQDNMPKCDRSEPQVKGNFYRISVSKGYELLRDMYIECCGKYIFCHRKRSEGPRAYIDILFTRIKRVTNLDKDGNLQDSKSTSTSYYGIRIIKNQRYEDIVHKDIAECDKL